MGSGKSTIGARLARQLNAPFVDMDAYIEEQAGMKIPEIFEKFGEPHFRDLETQAVRDLAVREGVIACGGGAMLRDVNAEIAKATGCVLFLDVPFNVCYVRIANTDRPIVRRSTRQELEALYNTRRGVYQKNSTHRIDASKSPAAIISSILEVFDK